MPAKKKVTLKTRTPSGRALGIVKRTAKPSRLDAQRYHESFFALTEGVVMVSDAGRVIAANPKAKAILGMTAKKMEQALRNDSAWRAIKADDTPFPAANFPIRKCLRTGKPQKNVLIGIRPGGKALRWLLVNTQPLFSGSKSKPVAIVASFEKATQRHCAEVKNARRATASNTTPNAITSTGHNDVSLNKEALQRTRSNEELFRLALNCIPDALLIYDHDFRLQFVNQRGAEFFASNSADIVGKRDEDLLPLDVTRSYLPVLQQARASKVLQSVELTFSLRGRQISIAATYVPMLDESGKVWQILGMLRDITNRRQTEERLSFMAQYDSLTGLPNRYLLLDRLEAAMQRAKRNNTLLGVMILDIDRFKHINDSRGHATGDILLQQVAARLACSLRATDTIARIGGDEFTVLVENATSVEEISSIAEKVKNAFSTPFETESGEVFTTTSVGITIYPHDDHNRDELLKNADLAMYHAKQQRNAWQLYSPDMNSNSANRLGMEVELRQALERDEFELHFLPQLQVRTGALVGMEALIRWNNKALGRVSPGDFIPLGTVNK